MTPVGGYGVLPGHGRTFAQQEALCGVPFVLRPRSTTLWPERSPRHAMLARCDTRCSASLGGYWRGRGITVCDEWLSSFLAFALHIGPRPTMKHSIDRIDNDGNYEPGNVRWATKQEQGRNTSQTVFLVFRGATMCIKDAAAAAGVPYQKLIRRLRKFDRDSDRAFIDLGVDPFAPAIVATIGGC